MMQRSCFKHIFVS